MGKTGSRSKRLQDKLRKRQSRQQVMESMIYFPVGSEWKRNVQNLMGIPTTTILNSLPDVPQPIQLSQPGVFQKINPDGNCFFSSLSFIITGSERYNRQIRHQICNHLITYSSELSQYLPLNYHRNVELYLNESKMQNSGTWATEVEIFTACHLLKTNIYIYTKSGVHWKWLRHSSSLTDDDHGIYLFHKDQNHYDVVLSIKNTTVLDQLPPNLKTYFVNQLRQDMKVKINERKRKTYQCNDAARKEKCAKMRMSYKVDKTYREKKIIQSKLKYESDPKFKEKKKEKSKLNSKLKYNRDSKFRNKKVKDSKLRSRQKYASDKKHRDFKMLATVLKYAKNPTFRQYVKSYSVRKYSSNRKFKESVKIASVKKYSENKSFRDSVKKASVKKYSENEAYRDSVKKTSVTKYSENEAYRDSVKKASVTKYSENEAYRDSVKKASVTKYSENEAFRDSVKRASLKKYIENEAFRDSVKKASLKKYSENETFRDKVKSTSREKYQRFESFRNNLKASSIKKYSTDPLFRTKLKSFLQHKYHGCTAVRLKKMNLVQLRRKSIQTALKTFAKNISDTPTYVCTVCIRTLYKNQVKECKRDRYSEDGKLSEIASKCLTGRYVHKCYFNKCPPHCKEIKNSKEWICFTCDRHLLLGNMPPQAEANSMNLPSTPEQLEKLSVIEKHLIARRIPFMKLLALPRGGQKGVKGPVVNVPSDLNTVATTLPHSIDSSQLIKVKLKRKLSYKGHYKYEWVNPNSVRDAVKYLITNNMWYSDVKLNDSWFDVAKDSDIVREYSPEDDSTDEDDSQQIESQNNFGNRIDSTIEGKQEDKTQDHDTSKDCEHKYVIKDNSKEDTQSINFPVETCFQPIDIAQDFLDTNDKIFCVAPAENETPKSIFQEEGAEAMAFPWLFPDGQFGFSVERRRKLSLSKYFNARLFSADGRFASDIQYIFFAQYVIELNHIRSSMSVALRKGKDTTSDGKKVTASMLTCTDRLKDILKSDIGFRFLQPIRGTSPYWQRTLKELYAMIRQLGVPTWFVTFSAAETRWDEVIGTLLVQKGDKRKPADIEWTEKCKLIKDNAVTCARLFDHRVKCLFRDLILSPAQPIGEVTDHFFRTEFQQRGSPHIHCLMWIKDAPKFSDSRDNEICRFVDRYISCELPNADKDPELYKIVTSVQMHSKSHSKSCKKHSDTCRFHFPRPPIKETFIVRSDSEEKEIETEGNVEIELDAPTIEEIDELSRKSSRSATQILKDIWHLISQIDNLQDQSFDTLLEMAQLTYDEFQDALKSLTQKNAIFHKRKMTDCWVNNYNKDLLRAWGANLDIQYVTDAYSCVAYILSYISKAETEMGELLLNAKKDAQEGNADAATAMKQIGNVYMQNRDVSAQEAVYRACGMHLKECSRDVMFLPTGSNAFKMSLPISVIKAREKSGRDNDNIWMTSIIDKYHARPNSEDFNNMCNKATKNCLCLNFRMV